ncbi:MAG: alpha/beta hydrolase [Bdellovibrio sp.]
MLPTRHWILLRGLARGAGHWGSFIEKMQERFPDDEIELIDLPGNGSRHRETSPLEVKDYVRDLRQRSRTVQDGKSFHLLAVSLGAMIAVEWMREFPHEVEKAYLVCTSSSSYSPFYQRFQPINILKALPLFITRPEGAEVERIILDMITNSHARRQAEVLGLSTYSDTHPLRRQNALRQLVAAARYKFPQGAPGEVKLIGTYGDRLVSPQCTLSIAQAWGLKPAMHPWAGHDIPLDDPFWLLEQIT